MEQDEKMKKQKKISALLLVLFMILSFAACGKSDANAVGTWTMKMDLSVALKEEMGSEFADFNTPFLFTLNLTLNKDGSYKMYIDEKATEKDSETYIAALADFFTEYLYSAKEAEGFDRATAQAAIEEQFGMPVYDYELQAVRESIDITELADSMAQEGVYEVKNGRFYMGLDKINKKIYDLITIDGDKMTLNSAEDADASPFFDESIPGLSYPFELTRVN